MKAETYASALGSLSQNLTVTQGIADIFNLT